MAANPAAAPLLAGQPPSATTDAVPPDALPNPKEQGEWSTPWSTWVGVRKILEFWSPAQSKLLATEPDLDLTRWNGEKDPVVAKGLELTKLWLEGFSTDEQAMRVVEALSLKVEKHMYHWAQSMVAGPVVISASKANVYSWACFLIFPMVAFPFCDCGDEGGMATYPLWLVGVLSLVSFFSMFWEYKGLKRILPAQVFINFVTRLYMREDKEERRLFISGQCTPAAWQNCKEWLGAKDASDWGGCLPAGAAVNVSAPPFNFPELAAGQVSFPSGYKKLNVPVYGGILDEVMLLFDNDNFKACAERMNIKIPQYKIDSFLKGKMGWVRDMVSAARNLASCTGPNLEACDKLKVFADDFEKINDADFTSMPAWKGFMGKHVAPGWENKLSFDDALSNFGFDEACARELRNLEVEVKDEKAGTSQMVKWEYQGLRWVTKAMTGFKPAGCLTDVVNLVFAMKGYTAEKVDAGLSEAKIKDVIRAFGSDKQDLWVPTHMIVDCESDDMLAWCLVESIQKPNVLVQLPEDKDADLIANHLSASPKCKVFRDPGSRNMKALAGYWTFLPVAASPQATSPSAQPTSARQDSCNSASFTPNRPIPELFDEFHPKFWGMKIKVRQFQVLYFCFSCLSGLDMVTNSLFLAKALKTKFCPKDVISITWQRILDNANWPWTGLSDVPFSFLVLFAWVLMIVQIGKAFVNSVPVLRKEKFRSGLNFYMNNRCAKETSYRFFPKYFCLALGDQIPIHHEDAALALADCARFQTYRFMPQMLSVARFSSYEKFVTDLDLRPVHYARAMRGVLMKFMFHTMLETMFFMQIQATSIGLARCVNIHHFIDKQLLASTLLSIASSTITFVQTCIEFKNIQKGLWSLRKCDRDYTCAIEFLNPQEREEKNKRGANWNFTAYRREQDRTMRNWGFMYALGFWLAAVLFIIIIIWAMLKVFMNSTDCACGWNWSFPLDDGCVDDPSSGPITVQR